MYLPSKHTFIIERLLFFCLIKYCKMPRVKYYTYLYDMQPTQKYNEINSAINMDLIYAEVSRKTKVGAPTELNYPAMIISFFIRYVERIPTIKDLIKRLNDDIAFKLNCGFRVSDAVPSESSYSRLVTQLSESNVLDEVKERLIIQAIKEGFVTDDTVAI